MEDIKKLEDDFSKAAVKTVLELQEKIEKLEAENKSLISLIEGNTPSLEFSPTNFGISNEQLICETQIAILKGKAIKAELNADEVRRFSQLFDVLEKIKKSSVNVEDVIINQTSSEDLLKLVVNNEPGK
jgi:tetrahydromethanopterin S-methyltransferase subunit B